MKLKTLLETGEPLVKVASLPDYVVTNPEEGDVEKAEKEQKPDQLIVKKGSEDDKKNKAEPKGEAVPKSTKALIAGLLDAIKAFVQEV